jgi:arylsulfatase A-like enzyme
MTRLKSLLLVTVDCLRADHVGFMGYSRPTTPFLDSLAGESFVFPSALVAGAPTYYSLPSILASRYPLALGRDQIGLAPGEVTLATTLKESGYATAAFCAGNPYLSQRFGYEQGFDKFEDHLAAEPVSPASAAPAASRDSRWISRVNRKLDSVAHQLGPVGSIYDELYFQYCQRWATPPAGSLEELRRFPAADVLVNQALEWLDSVSDTPFFLWLHFMDPHSPYYPKQAALEAMREREVTPDRARYLNAYWNRSDLRRPGLSRHRDEIVRLYDAGIRWVDVQLARLVAHLEKLKRWDRCVFAFTADHGEEFLDHGGRYHPPDRLMEELVHVPLLLRMPGTEPKPLSKSAFSLLHLAPTLLEAAGRPLPDSFEGQSHWPQMQEGKRWESPAIAESIAGCTNPFQPRNRLGPRVLVMREARFKLVLHFNPRAEELYDLEADPGEQSPLPAEAEKTVRRRLLETAHDHLRRSASKRDVHLRLRSRLRELQLEWSNDSVVPSLPA